VLHVEFDTTGTGLKYAIGEALGVHGWNDEAEVLDFCRWYGVDSARLVTIPVPGDDTKVHTRTVLQALQHLFGKPPKSFYPDLAEYAKSSVDRHALLFVGSPEGVSTFKKLSEKDTVTFGDVLRRYTSARPGIEVLCKLVGDIKPRHYSIPKESRLGLYTTTLGPVINRKSICIAKRLVATHKLSSHDVNLPLLSELLRCRDHTQKNTKNSQLIYFPTAIC
jgi:sulfite reductase alpha subunit-like flavoprotein